MHLYKLLKREYYNLKVVARRPFFCKEWLLPNQKELLLLSNQFIKSSNDEKRNGFKPKERNNLVSTQ